ALFLGVASYPRIHAGDLSSQQREWLAKGYRYNSNGWVYLHVEGAPRERGFQNGYLLAPEIATALNATRVSWRHGSGMEWSWLVTKSRRIINPWVDAENLAELQGIAEGARAHGVETSLDEIVAYNAIIDLAGYWWPDEKKKWDYSSPTPPKDACSSFIAVGSATADGGVVLGHNTMSGYTDTLYYVIEDILPAKGHRILMQTQPGWVHSGTDFFITDAGLVGSETTIGGFHGFKEKAIPEFVRMRRATQDASTIEQWCEIMKKGNNGGYANAWLLGDVNKNEIALLELGLKFVAFEKKTDGFFVSSNVAEDLKILRLETDANETDIRVSGVARQVRWKELMRQNAGKIDLEMAKKFEADHYDPYLKRENPAGRSLCAHKDLDDRLNSPGVPFDPAGTADGKVVDSKLAKQMAFSARWGAACGTAFDAPAFLAAHPQFSWMKDILQSRPSQPWTVFRAGEKQLTGPVKQ
ncbi:MAG TPA: C45 family peptidase, partial [Verrucomicrobiae bacterium]|nr:C45 family peptidase [Verrucomicrobiae bacterium]